MEKSQTIEPTTLIITTDEGEKQLIFDHPHNRNDKEQMFRQRAKVYSSKGYFLDNNINLDIDTFDEQNKCVYFTAKLNNRLVGSVRLIFDKELPTEKYFDFSEPQSLAKIPRQQRTEISRLVVERQEGDKYPRNLIMLFLIWQMNKFAGKNKILGGYSFVKKRLLHKLRKLNFPIHEIDQQTQLYPENGILYNYFNDQSDPVIATFFLTKEVQEYIEKNLNRRGLFKAEDNNTLRLQDSLYTAFLKRMKII